MNDREHMQGFVRFKLRAHLWNHHRVWSPAGLPLAELGEIHLFYNCPAGEARRYLGCHLRLVPRRVPRPRHQPPDSGTTTR